MDKQTAIAILENIGNTLDEVDWREKGIKATDIYIKGLKIATNEKIQNLIHRQDKYSKLYGENSKKTLKLSKKVDKEIRKIFNS